MGLRASTWIISVLLCLLPVGLFAATYYVSPSGDDSYPGSQSQPWLTIQKAADTLVAGDTVHIRAGTYNEVVTAANSGSAGSAITYSAYPGEAATIDGTGLTVPDDTGLFNIIGKNYITITGLHVINSGFAGIYAEYSGFLTVQGNYTYNTDSSGIGIWNCNNVIVDENEVNRPCNGYWQESISMANTDTFEIRNNYVHDSGNPDKEGITVKDGSCNGTVYGNEVHNTRQGIYVDGESTYTYNIDVYQNVLHDNYGDGILLGTEGGGLVENVSVYNNISYDNALNGVDISACCIATHPMNNLAIINNTLYQNGYGSLNWGQGVYIENEQVTNFVFRNNICSQNNTYQIAFGFIPNNNYTLDHNLIDGVTDYYGDAYVEGDPLFVSPSLANFHLDAASPAVDTGSSLGAPGVDYDGVPRPSGGGVDIGAFEYPSGPLSYSDDFEDGILPDWTFLRGTWAETAGNLTGTNTRKAIAIAAPAFAGCSRCSIEAPIQTAGGIGNRVWVLGWYAGKSNSVELMMKEEAGRWVFKQRVNGQVVRKAKALGTIAPGVFYSTRMTFDGATFRVFIDNQPVITVDAYPGSSPNGTVGFQAKATTGAFASINVSGL